MSNFRNMMRRMRQYTTAVEKNYKSRAVELEKEADKKGSSYYERYAAEVDRKTEEKRVQLAKDAQKDLTGMIETMRQNVGKHITKAPTAEFVNTLSLLRMVDDLNPTEIRQYAVQMADCPLAMKVLSQIAATHQVYIATPNTEEMMRAVDTIEWNLAVYLQSFKGDGVMGATVKTLHDMYFQPEEYYMGTNVKTAENADKLFWENIVQIGSPEMLDDSESADKAINVKYFFKDIDGLMAFINKKTEGLEGKAADEKVEEILKDCPGQYGAAYRYYKANGEKVPLLEEGEME